MRRNRWQAVFTGVLVVVLASAIFLTARPREDLTAVERWIRDGVAPVEAMLSQATRFAIGVWDSVGELRVLQVENRRLRSEVEELRAENQQLLEHRRENERLREALGLEHGAGHDYIAAEVIARAPSNWWGTVTINKGRRDGIQPRSPVVTEAGVVGHIRTVSERTAQVILITDPRSAIGGLVRRTSDLVLVEGVGSPDRDIHLKPLVAGVELHRGDEVVTSGLGAIFPKGLPVGYIEDVSIGLYGLTSAARLMPFVDMTRLEIVAVLRSAAAPAGAAEDDL